MTRILSQPPQIFNDGFLPTGTATVTATGAIAANELVVHHEGGIFSRADPSMPWSSINQNASVAQLFAAQPVQNLVFSGGTAAKSCGIPRPLFNNTFCVPIQMSGGIGFHIRGQAGQQLTPYIQVSTDTSNVSPFIIPINGGQYFAHLYVTGANLKCSIWGVTGNQITGVFVVASNVYVGGQAPWFGAAVCGVAGGFIVHWCNTSSALVAQVFSNVGATVGSIITIDTSVTSAIHGCAPCFNGDVIVSHFDTTHSRHKFYRVTASGVVTWGPISPSSAPAFFTQPIAAQFPDITNRLFELYNNNTNYIACLLPNASNYANVYLLNPTTGATITVCDPGAQFHDTGMCNPICLTQDGFHMTHCNNSSVNTYGSFFDFLGNPYSTNVLIDSTGPVFPAGTTPVINLYCGVSGTNLSIMRYFSNQGVITLQQILCDKRGNAIYGSAIAHQTAGGDMGCPHPVCLPQGTTFAAWYGVSLTQLVCLSYKIGRSSVIGVAQNSAADGGSVVVNGAGYYTLPATQQFATGQAFDQRLSPVLGCQGDVGPGAAFLSGWSGGSFAPVTPPAVAASSITLIGVPPPPAPLPINVINGLRVNLATEQILINQANGTAS
jgi:hypothetical protein